MYYNELKKNKNRRREDRLMGMGNQKEQQKKEQRKKNGKVSMKMAFVIT